MLPAAREGKCATVCAQLRCGLCCDLNDPVHSVPERIASAISTKLVFHLATLGIGTECVDCLFLEVILSPAEALPIMLQGEMSVTDMAALAGASGACVSH